MMFVSIVGQASRQTTGRSGPSMIERSKRRFSPAGGADAGVWLCGAGTSADDAGDGVDEAGTVTILLISWG
jgi:hypothetical protein